MRKDVVIKGVVIQRTEERENQGMYKIQAGEKEFYVYAEGKQAIRDWILFEKNRMLL